MKTTTIVASIAQDLWSTPTPEKVSEFMRTIVNGLPQAAQRAVANALEERFIADIPANWSDPDAVLARDFLRAASPVEIKGFCSDTLPLPAAQARAFIMDHVASLKGGETHAVVKTYLEGVSAMTDDEYHSAPAHMKLLMSLPATAGMTPPAPLQPNPFRKYSL